MLRKKLKAALKANSAFDKLKFLNLLSTLQMNTLNYYRNYYYNYYNKRFLN